MIAKINSAIPDWLKNRYVVTLLVFAVWMAFFDQNDVFTMFKLEKEAYDIQQEKAYYQVQIEETRADLENLMNDNAKLEKFAREEYLMKRDNEDLFVIVVE